MLRRAVIVPDAPALVPALGGAGSPTLQAVRDAMIRAVGDPGDPGGRWTAVGPGERTRLIDAGTGARLTAYGREGELGLSEAPSAHEDNPEPTLLVAAWLRETARLPGMTVQLVGPDASAEECAVLGKQLAADTDTLLVLGSGSFTWEPGDGTDHSDHPVDTAVRRALAGGDTAPLCALDATECAGVHAGGRAPWQVLAGAVDGARVTADLLYSDAPFGVRYHVATWDLTR
ncbi:hypothetical protein HJ588_17505 [Flexivirga sp. ID2601S]|uniref:Uncharacterized protein n=1 Tax=Flexivirga aerilata TaxID=1656889 RepID=A0A849AP11_9MICO|nr:hypothetical protein [Flexivirga aerilata]NNG41058.1 hypothetical protein [Flexivirga aerilata]